ncbi:PTS cellobiose transporter subunit IIC [Sporosalibacterium faouarense]|uniref:PTS cellobiose transporter subunit IIC n=1 Tax=Sporosalibacterium faouarense TaxID=516123 RepID=UPI00141CCCA2|nr:PTS cellobiose transporter subunit IIC [Sporosalibacterium faouarense]MTI47554.1 PTS cellobiose transporter subunit IIC [Bacillota bacterium]
MRSIFDFLEKRFVPIAAKIGAQRHLVAIRDGFVAIMPLIIVGSMAVLINNLPIDAYQNFMSSIFSDSWTSFGGNLWNGTFAVLSLFIVFSISYNLAKSYDSDPLAAGIIGFASLMVITQSAEEAWAIPYNWTGALGLLVSIMVAIISTEIFVRLLGNKRLVIKMPEGVPPAVSKSFAALLPGIITLSVFSVIKIITVAIGIVNIHAALYDLIQGPLTEMANTIWSAIFIAFINHFLWFFGLHGSNILEPIMQAVYLPALDANMTALANSTALPYIVTKPFFDAFVYMGGAGTTISLLIAIFIATKRKHMRDLAKMGFAPGLFNINEPMIYGFPIVLNPVLFIPFLLTPVVLTIFSFIVTAIGIVPRTVALIPWTTPPIIGGYLATGGSIMGAILPLINIVIGVLLYVPFVLIIDKIEAKKESLAEN